MSVHMPHNGKAPKKNTKEYSDDDYLQCLQCIDDIVKTLDKNTIPLIFGDFNAQIGKRETGGLAH